MVDRLLGRLDEDFGGWQISKARGHAWHHALELALALPSERVAIVRHMDRYVVRLANHLLVAKHPPACIPWWIARRLERTHVREIIESIEGAS